MFYILAWDNKMLITHIASMRIFRFVKELEFFCQLYFITITLSFPSESISVMELSGVMGISVKVAVLSE